MSVIVEDWGQFIEIEFYESYNNVPEVIKYNNVYIIKHNNKNKNNKIIPINLETNETNYKDEYKYEHKDNYKNNNDYEYLNNYYNDDEVNDIINKNNIESNNRNKDEINNDIKDDKKQKTIMLSLSNINIINTFYNYKRYLILFISISVIIFSPLCLIKINF